MSLEVGKSFGVLVKHSGSRRNLEVDFWWRALMNFEIIKKLVMYGKDQRRITINIFVLL